MKIHKVFAWSIALEPMVYFNMVHPRVFGVGANLSRMFQVIVLFFLITSICIGKRSLIFPNPLNDRYYLLIRYFSFALISGLVGIVMGIYVFDGHISNLGSNVVSSFLKSPYMRPLFEYFILFYYIVYFTIFPAVFFKKEEDVKYFFKVFFLIFNLSLLFGLIDLFCIAQYQFTITSRHIFEWYTSGPVNIGFRFHGFFGEPRDAFVVLGLGAGFYYLRSVTLNHSHRKWYYVLLLTCALLTQSNSGLLGVVIFLGIYITINSLRFKYFIRLIIVTLFFCSVLYVGTMYSPRILMVLDAVSTLKIVYETGATLPPIIETQKQDIYPIFWLADNFFKFNLVPLLLGTGLGSASFITKMYAGTNELSNPNSNIIRIVVETGIIGLITYISAFYIPVKRMARGLPLKKIKNITLLSLFILSLSLSNRSSSPFIFIGVFFATMNVFAPKSES